MSEINPNVASAAINTPERKPTINRWRRGIHGGIEQVLAPKGFSPINSGPHRGTMKSKLDFLSKKLVNQVQNLAVNSFDMYRNNLANSLSLLIEANNKQLTQAIKDLDATHWWKPLLRAGIKQTIYRLEGQNEAIKNVLQEMNYVEVK